MAIALGDNIQTGAPKPTDSRYLNNQVPYTGETEVNTLITGGVGGVRYTGLTVNIGGTEYWYKEGIGDEDLIEKTSSGGGSSNLAWTGSTANAIGTYMSVSGICAQSGLTFDGTTLSVSGAIDGNSTLDILGATCLHDTLAVTGATSLSAVASYLTDLSPFTARQIPDAEWVTGQTNAVCLGWSNLISGSTVAGCGTIASGTSECNTFYGVCAGQDITNGSDNVGIGFSVLANTTTGNHNIGMGYDALGLNVSGHCNIGIGYQAIKANTSGFGNVGVGIKALCKNTTGVVNVAIGYQSMQVHTTGSENTSIGYMAMAATTGGSCNTAIGTQSLAKNTGGEANIAIGYMAMCGNLLAGCNIGIGVKTMSSINTGVENIAIGKWALCENLGGSNGVAIGASALQENTTGDGNVAIGQCAGAINTIGSNNVFIGRCAGYSETGSSKLHIGNCADCSLIYGDFTGKTVIIDDKLSTCKLQVTSGASSGCVLTSDASGNATWQTGGGGISGIGWSNLANGSTVAGCGTTVSGGTPYLCHSTTYGVEAAVSGGTGDPYARGQDNVAIGYRALYSNVTRSENTAVGTQALYANYNGSANTALGYQTLYFNCVGGSNVAIGANALRANRCGGANVAVGTGALDAKTCGDYNVGIGDGAFGGNTTGSTNTALGYRAGSSNISGSSNVFLGRYAGYSETGSDRLHIAISNTCSLIYGEFDNKLVCIDDALVTCCFQMLSGASDGCVLTSDASGNATWETGGGAGTITGGINGLSTSGTNVILGGDLTGNTSIGGDWTKTFTITGISTGLFQSDGAMAICSSSGSLTMHACSSGFVVGIGGTIYNDNGQSGTKGIFYNDDYNASSSNPRWLPDAEWVTGQTSSAVTIGSTGQIPYSDTGTPGTDFVYDANFIYSGGKLGIGTTAPNVKLESWGGVNANPATTGTAQTGASLRLKGGDNGVLDIGGYSSLFWLQGTNQADLSLTYNLALNPNGGDVGIGTAAPILPLHVRRTANGAKMLVQTYSSTVNYYASLLFKVSANAAANYMKGGIAFERTGTGTGKLHLLNDIVSDSGNAILSDAKLTIDDTGYVGIGTASPDKLLEISADTDATLRITSTDIPLDVPINLGLIEFYGSSTYAPGAGVKAQIAIVSDSYGDDAHMDFYTSDGTAANNQFRMTIAGGGNVGIGTISPNYQLELSSDSAGKPGAGGLWTIVSDSRLKENIVLADLDRSYEIVKTLPLKHFTWKDSTYTPEQVRDRSSLGWIAEDVQKVFPKAVGVKEFNLLTKTSSGTEQYEEQDYIIETGITTTTEIQVISGTPIQITRTGITENKVMLFDDVEVKDISGNTIYTNKNVETFDASGNTITTVEKAPLIHSVPRMITKTRIKYIQDTIPDCLDLNTGQVYTVMYGALQKTMEMLEDALIKLENALERIDVLEN